MKYEKDKIAVIHVRVAEEFKDAVEEAAKKQGMTKSEFIRMALENAMMEGK